MSSQFRPIEIPPGVVSKATKKMRSSNWSEVNMIRWREGQLMPMGGQAQLTNKTGDPPYQFASRCKMIHGWFDLTSVYHIAYLCETNLYVDTGGTLTDITPAGGMGQEAGITGGYGDGVYNQGGQAKAAAAFTTSTTTIAMSSNPGNVPAGVDVFDITTGQDIGRVSTYNGTTLVLQAAALSASQGANDLLNFGAYNEPRSIPGSVAVTKIPDAYSLDNFGAILYAMTSMDGRLLMWDPAVGGRAVVQPATSGRGPVPNGRCFVVTQERFIVIFGSINDGTVDGGSARRFAWCDQENPGAWDYSNVTSQAGFLDVEPANPILCAVASRVGIIFWTTKKCCSSRFLGLPYVYNYVELADGTTPWSSQSICTTSAITLWMSEQGVFSYDGTSVLPMQCPIRSWVDENYDPVTVRELAFAAHVAQYNEWWWFFPTLNSSFNTRAIVYNYKEGWWTQVRASRSAGITSSYNTYPIFADDTVAIQHEVYQAPNYINYNMPVVLPFAESFDLNLVSGSRLTTVKQLISDVEALETTDPISIANIMSNLRYSLFYQNSRSLGTPEQQSPQIVPRTDGFVDFRVTGRDVRLRIDMASPVVEQFTLGQHLIDSVPRGDR